MLFDMLVLFILLTIIILVISVFLVEDRPLLSIPFVMIGMIFSILCTYGFYDVEIYSNVFNSTSGLSSVEVTHFMEWGDPYAYVFMLLFFVFFILFIRAGFNMWQLALETQGSVDYRLR
jgi:hypothetical protein